jgi:hypothetical protein
MQVFASLRVRYRLSYGPERVEQHNLRTRPCDISTEWLDTSQSAYVLLSKLIQQYLRLASALRAAEQHVVKWHEQFLVVALAEFWLLAPLVE